jgi:signal transduction histidine kinase
MPLPSLRSRLLLGAMLWTLGLFAAAMVVSTALMLRNPTYPRVLHGTAMAHGTTLTLVAVLCMVVGFWLVRRGVSPINQLRARLAAVHQGRDRRVDGKYPWEVQPLVDDLNTLLEHRDLAIARALAKAGDLAHGLKTPLALLAHDADRAAADGHTELASTIGEQVQRMRRQIDYHLAHARAAASGVASGARCAVAESAEGLARTLTRLHSSRSLEIRVEVPPEHVVRVQREDLDEMLGNLLENACKWARRQVRLSSSLSTDGVDLLVEDDGPGIAPALRDAVMQRGVRADEAAPGSGFGLAIVRDLVELYGGSIALETSSLGGLRARLTLPSAADDSSQPSAISRQRELRTQRPRAES